jgi:hypothetical protein
VREPASNNVSAIYVGKGFPTYDENNRNKKAGISRLFKFK